MKPELGRRSRRVSLRGLLSLRHGRFLWSSNSCGYFVTALSEDKVGKGMVSQVLALLPWAS